MITAAFHLSWLQNFTTISIDQFTQTRPTELERTTRPGKPRSMIPRTELVLVFSRTRWEMWTGTTRKSLLYRLPGVVMYSLKTHLRETTSLPLDSPATFSSPQHGVQFETPIPVYRSDSSSPTEKRMGSHQNDFAHIHLHSYLEISSFID